MPLAVTGDHLPNNSETISSLSPLNLCPWPIEAHFPSVHFFSFTKQTFWQIFLGWWSLTVLPEEG